MSDETQVDSGKASKKTGTKAVALVCLCIVACKLPFLLALLGFGGIGVMASMLELSLLQQTLGIAVGVLGVAAVAACFFYRMFRRTNP